MTDRKFEWLGHIFEILTQLDPYFIGAYHFGGITLAWDAHEPYSAIALLRKGTRANPLNWQLPFDIGFIHYTLLDNYDAAGYYFLIASKLPNAWSMVSRWSAFAYAKAGKVNVSRQIWIDLYNQTDNKALKALIERNLAFLIAKEDMGILQTAVQNYRKSQGRYPTNLLELLRKGYIKNLPKDPWGGSYVLKDSIVISPNLTKLRRQGFFATPQK